MTLPLLSHACSPCRKRLPRLREKTPRSRLADLSVDSTVSCTPTARRLFPKSREEKGQHLVEASGDSTSTCEPAYSGFSSGNSDCPDNVGALEAFLKDLCSNGTKRPQHEVCIIHHDDMQLHVPPKTEDVFELPRRVIAIENCFKGLDLREGFSQRQRFEGPMQFFPKCPGKRQCSEGYGCASKKKRRVSFSTGIASAESAWDACRIVQAPLVKDEDLLLVHSERHIAKVAQACSLAVAENAAFWTLTRALERPPPTPGPDDLNEDVYYSPSSLLAFKRAAGGAVEAVQQLFRIDQSTGRAADRSDVGATFAIVRPPGHHCCDDPNGFCFFNNTAIAAAHARAVLGLSRVAVVDWDYHHGDGTQAVFYRDPTVLTISLHVAVADGEHAFPCNKDMGLEDNGLGMGRGYNINIPWPHDRVGSEEYDEAFRTIVVPALHGFDPELILVAAGFDATAGDMLAGTRLPPRGFHAMTRQLVDLGKPLAIILEGGYSPDLLAQSSLNVLHALLGREPPSERRLLRRATSAASSASDVEREDGTRILDAVRRRLNTLPPWASMTRPSQSKFFNEDPAPEAAAKSRSAAERLQNFILQKAEK